MIGIVLDHYEYDSTVYALVDAWAYPGYSPALCLNVMLQQHMV